VSVGERLRYTVAAPAKDIQVGAVVHHQGKRLKVIAVSEVRNERDKGSVIDFTAMELPPIRRLSYTFLEKDASRFKVGDPFGEHMVVVAISKVRDSLDGTERAIDIIVELIDRGGPVQ